MSETSSNATWIYLLITAFVAIFGIFKSKINKMNDSDESTELPEPAFQDLFPAHNTNPKIDINHEYSNTRNKEGYIPPFKVKNDVSTATFQKFPTSTISEEIIEDGEYLKDIDSFDLKQAVIYKEILDRKYF
ncbi:MAG: hypothetical protein LBM07_00450 [Culturomica sp.]|jgi:hypothetical protein|nr:hypothetical protein [Culturomica sp.]